MESLATACQLCGAYLLLYENLTVESLRALFDELLKDAISSQSTNETPTYEILIVESWNALHCARGLDWLSLGEMEGELDMEMARHYALGSNGSVHTLVPGKLLLFPAPKALPLNQAWADVAVPGQPTARRFSATFFASLLPELGVSAVVCLGRTSGTAAAAFRAGGLDVHDLALDAGQPALLGAMDRLLSVSRAAPGATALFPGSGHGEVALEWVRTLAAAWLMTDCGFGSGAAAAWVRMVCPAGWPP